MVSLSNRFAVLGQAAPSSTEQEIRVPVTDMEDQTMQDNTQAGPPMSIGGLEGSIPHVLTREEKIPTFHKKRLQWEAEEREKERLKKSRQRSNRSTFVGRPIPFPPPSQGLRKRTASSDEAEKSSKRMKLDSVASATTVGANSSASALGVQRDTVLSPWWAQIQTPKLPLLCIVQLGYLARIGSFDEDTRAWAFHLILDADQRQSSTMIMNFFSKGVKGQLNGQIEWCLGYVTNDDWMVTDIKIQRVADCL